MHNGTRWFLSAVSCFPAFFISVLMMMMIFIVLLLFPLLFNYIKCDKFHRDSPHYNPDRKFNFPQDPSFTKVIVPATYEEFKVHGTPSWVTDPKIMKQYGYSVYLYQKLDSAKPNYIRNRGTEGAVYLRYIVDHYDNFPDVAIFVHAGPTRHAQRWLERVGCISPNATYMNINFQHMERDTTVWGGENELWIEQCFRDLLKIAWGLEDNLDEFHRRVPPSKPVHVTFSCCQQFILSRKMVHARPLAVWKKLLHVVNEQDVCHEGEPDYANLFAFSRDKKQVGPEPSSLVTGAEKSRNGYGGLTQGMAMEHLAHVIFGGMELDGNTKPSKELICQNFLPNCPYSPCTK